jgi:Ser/Thr protein kinase RdoA (MazF antagonist)
VPHTHDIDMTGDVVRKVYVSWSDAEPDREWAALQHLGLHATGLAPRPISRIAVGDRPAVVMSRVPGRPLTGRLTQTQTRALAVALRRLFASPMSSSTLHRGSSGDSMLHRCFRHLI